MSMCLWVLVNVCVCLWGSSYCVLMCVCGALVNVSVCLWALVNVLMCVCGALVNVLMCVCGL